MPAAAPHNAAMHTVESQAMLVDARLSEKNGPGTSKRRTQGPWPNKEPRSDTWAHVPWDHRRWASEPWQMGTYKPKSYEQRAQGPINPGFVPI